MKPHKTNVTKWLRPPDLLLTSQKSVLERKKLQWKSTTSWISDSLVGLKEDPKQRSITVHINRNGGKTDNSFSVKLRSTNWWWLFRHLWGFWENVGSFIPYLQFCFFFSFKVEISSRTLILLFRPGSVHSGSVSWHNHGWVFPDKL